MRPEYGLSLIPPQVSLTAILVYILVDLQLPLFEGKEFPEGAYIAGWVLSGIALGMVPVCFVHAFAIAQGGPLDRLKAVFRPKDTWGPKKMKNRKEWEKVCHNH